MVQYEIMSKAQSIWPIAACDPVWLCCESPLCGASLEAWDMGNAWSDGDEFGAYDERVWNGSIGSANNC